MRLLLLILIFALTPFPDSAQTPSASAFFPIEIKGKHGYINSSGKIVIRPQFDDARGFSEGLASVLVSDKWGFIDKTGTIVIAPQFFEAGHFKEGLAVVGAFFKSGPIHSQYVMMLEVCITLCATIGPVFVSACKSNPWARRESES